MRQYTISTLVTFRTSHVLLSIRILQYRAAIDEVSHPCRSHNSNSSIQSSYTYNFFAALSIQSNDLSWSYISHADGVICCFVALHISEHPCGLSESVKEEVNHPSIVCNKLIIRIK